jgi:hypothetical protein
MVRKVYMVPGDRCRKKERSAAHIPNMHERRRRKHAGIKKTNPKKHSVGSIFGMFRLWIAAKHMCTIRGIKHRRIPAAAERTMFIRRNIIRHDRVHIRDKWCGRGGVFPGANTGGRKKRKKNCQHNPINKA